MTDEERKRRETMAKLDQAKYDAPPLLLHDVAVSMASFIAEIDANSNDVAAYIEQRLAPLVPMMRTDIRVLDAIARIGADGRKLQRRP
jgi:hypothetical protein